MPLVEAELARVLVDDVDRALPLYEKLSEQMTPSVSALETSNWRG
jgi:hypothetical protein